MTILRTIEIGEATKEAMEDWLKFLPYQQYANIANELLRSSIEYNRGNLNYSRDHLYEALVLLSYTKAIDYSIELYYLYELIAAQTITFDLIILTELYTWLEQEAYIRIRNQNLGVFNIEAKVIDDLTKLTK